MARARNESDKKEGDSKDVSADVRLPAGQDPSKETEARSAGQDPNPDVKPSEDASEETPDATATPPQRVQGEKSNLARHGTEEVEARTDTVTKVKEPNTYKVRVLRGAHQEGGKTYTRSSGWFESKTDLVGRFGTEKFENQKAQEDKNK